MENAEADEYQLKRNASKKLQEVLGEFRVLILREAKEATAGKPIGPEDIDTAYYRLGFPNRGIEDAQTIITQTLRENRAVEWVAYGMAAILFAMGIGLLFLGVFSSGDASLRVTSIISGSLLELLLLMPVRLAMNSRRHNIAIRMLGILIDRVREPEKLAVLLNDTFRAIIVGDAPVDSR